MSRTASARARLWVEIRLWWCSVLLFWLFAANPRDWPGSDAFLLGLGHLSKIMLAVSGREPEPSEGA